MISLSGAAWFVLYLIIGGVIFGLLDMLIQKAPFMPEGWKPIGRYVLLVIAVFVVIGILISMVGGGGPSQIFRP